MTEDLEEPGFKVIEEYEGFEIRKYTDTIQAQVASPTFKEVNSSIHFREIANYIFGNNRKTQSIAMTAPVQTWEEHGENFMAFTMPSKFNINNLPKPNSNRIKLTNVKGGLVAVLKFSWFSGSARTGKLIKKLQKLTKAKGLMQNGSPKLAVYNNPMTTIPFMRRNEIHLPITGN
tara:strand:+ start:3826 stop:4350 length:525 start_codon:yes stop_codon:yes gene_type:complete